MVCVHVDWSMNYVVSCCVESRGLDSDYTQACIWQFQVCISWAVGLCYVMLCNRSEACELIPTHSE